MNTTQGEHTPAELPGPPHPRSLNVTQQGTFGEAAFDSMYRRFKGAEHYEDAKKAFLSPSLNRALVSGVNTWHEQVLAGRVTLDDLKTMGYTNLARHREQTEMILGILTRDSNPMTAAEVRIALDLARTSLLFGLNPPMRLSTKHGLNVLLQFVAGFGKDAKRVRYHSDIKLAVGRALSDKHIRNHEHALELMMFVDGFFAALQEYIRAGELRTYDDRSYPVIYKNHDFITLMEAGLTPAQVAKSVIQGLSPERAVVVKTADIPDSLVDGAL